MSEALRRQVLALYQEVDRAVAAAGPVCVASGRCCRFKEYGHTLFISNLEAEVLLDGAPPFERRTRPLPLTLKRLAAARLVFIFGMIDSPRRPELQTGVLEMRSL